MTDQPAECPDACIEHHTYRDDCAATRTDYDPKVGMRERYAKALAGWAGSKAFSPANTGTEWEHARSSWYGYADAALAARDVYLNNVRRISKQQTTQLAELYMTTKKRAAEDATASRESERILQQQIDAQAKEIDRLRDALAALEPPKEP